MSSIRGPQIGVTPLGLVAIPREDALSLFRMVVLRQAATAPEAVPPEEPARQRHELHGLPAGMHAEEPLFPRRGRAAAQHHVAVLGPMQAQVRAVDLELVSLPAAVSSGVEERAAAFRRESEGGGPRAVPPVFLALLPWVPPVGLAVCRRQHHALLAVALDGALFPGAVRVAPGARHAEPALLGGLLPQVAPLPVQAEAKGAGGG